MPRRNIPIKEAVGAFYNTFLGLREEQRRESDAAEERRWRGVLERLQVAQDRRAEETHQQDLERGAQQLDQGRYMLEQMGRDAEAAQAVFAKYGQNPETLAALSEEESRALNMELLKLNTQKAEQDILTSKYMLEHYYPAQVSAMTRSGQGGGGGDGGGEPRDRYDALVKRAQNLWKEIENTSTKDYDGNLTNIDPDLARSYMQTLDVMREVGNSLTAVDASYFQERGLLPEQLPQAKAASSEADPGRVFDELVPPSEKSQRGPTAFEKAAADVLAPVYPTGAKALYVDPVDGKIQWTSDEKVLMQAKKKGAQILNPEDVPRQWYGKSYAEFKAAKDRNKKNPTPTFSNPASAALYFQR